MLGSPVGSRDGSNVGLEVGSNEGRIVGCTVGTVEGVTVGSIVGLVDGFVDGFCVGLVDGFCVGGTLGVEGLVVGGLVGDEVGSTKMEDVMMTLSKLPPPTLYSESPNFPDIHQTEADRFMCSLSVGCRAQYVL